MVGTQLVSQYLQGSTMTTTGNYPDYEQTFG